MKKLHIAGVMLILMISLGLLSGCETTEEKTQIIRVAFNQPESHPEYKALEDFGEKFKEATNGRYEVEFEEWDKAIEEANEILEEKGVTFVESDVEAFREKCMPLLESIANRSEMTRQIYDDVMEIKEREEKTQ